MMSAPDRSCLLPVVLLALAVASPSEATELSVDLRGAPPDGTLVFQIYDDPDAFGRFRDPAREIVLSAQGDGEYLLRDIEGEEVALVVYVDQNGNGVLDRNFIGIPRESISISNNYRPKGPPSFDRARFRIEGNTSIELELFRMLGERGQIGVGLGAIGRSSPYLGSTQSVYQLIPTIAYIGDRLQWLGPEINFGLAGSDTARLALSAEYRIGSYEAADSPVLADLGDRKSTLLLGLGLEFDLPNGFELEAGYRHDALDRIGGGIAELALSRGFQAGLVRLSPEFSLSWTSSDINNHDFGVPEEASRPGRSVYAPVATTTLGLGVTGIAELTEDWRAILSVTGEFLDSNVRRSPIVEGETVLAGFVALTYSF